MSHWECVIVHVDDELKKFTADVKRLPLDKKKERLNPVDPFDGYVEMEFEAVGVNARDSIFVGHIFHWYIGYGATRYKRRIPTSKVVFLKKYGKNGKRINMKEVERKAKEYFKNIKWD